MAKITLALALGIAGSAIGTVPTPNPEAPMPVPPYHDPGTIINMPDDMFVSPEHQRRDGGLDPRCLVIDPLHNPCIPGNFPGEPVKRHENEGEQRQQEMEDESNGRYPMPMPTPVAPIDPVQHGSKRMVLPNPGSIPTPIMPFPGPPYGPAIKGEKRSEEERMVLPPGGPIPTPGSGYPGSFPRPYTGPFPDVAMAKGEKRNEEERMVLPADGSLPTPGIANAVVPPVDPEDLAAQDIEWERNKEERMVVPPSPIHTPGSGYPVPNPFTPPFLGPALAKEEKRDEEERMVRPPGPIPTPAYPYPGPFLGGLAKGGDKRDEEERMILPPGPIPTPGYGFPPYMPIANTNKRDEEERMVPPPGPIPTPGYGFPGPFHPGPLPMGKPQQQARRAKRCMALGSSPNCEHLDKTLPDPVEPENQRRGSQLDARCLVVDPRFNPCIPGNYHTDE